MVGAANLDIAGGGEGLEAVSRLADLDIARRGRQLGVAGGAGQFGMA